MRNPTKKQLQRVIDNFKRVLPFASKLDKIDDRSSVSMLSSEVDINCKTPMCHAGWYLASQKKVKKNSYKINFYNGANLMGIHLGFKCGSELEDWALSNAELWGNRNGSLMFGSTNAFNFRDKLTLAKIINHWKSVQKRLPK